MGDLPAWQPFDPSVGVLPDELASLASGDDAQVVALVATPGVDARWGGEAAVSIAGSLGESGDGVLLVDLGLSAPVLHEVLGHENAEGISDVLLYGVSMQHATRASELGSFLFATAGTPVVDPESVCTHPRWETVKRELRDRGITLLVYIPSDLPGASNVIAQAGYVIALASDDADASGITDAVAVLGPATEGAREPVVEAVEEPAADVPAAEEGPPEELAVEEPAALDVAEMMEDAVIEAAADVEEGVPEEAVDAPEVDSAEEESLDLMSSADEAGEDEPGLDEEEATAFEVEEPESDEFSLDGLSGTQYGQVDEGEDEGAGMFDADQLGGGEGEEDGLEVTVPLEFEADAVEAEAPAGLETASELDTPEDSGSPMEGLQPMELEPPTEATPSLEGLESSDTFEPMPVEEATAPGEADTHTVEADTHTGEADTHTGEAVAGEEEPTFDIGDGLELEAPELGEAPVLEVPEETPPSEQASDDAALDFGPGGDVLEVERSSLADDMDSPTDQPAMSGVSHGAGVADQLDEGGFTGDEPMADGALEVEDAVPREAAPADLGVVDAAAEAVGAGAPEPGPDAPDAQPEAAPDVEVREDRELERQPERRLSGLDELERRRKRQARRRTLVTAVLSLAVLGGGGYGVAYFGIVDVPGITPPGRISGGVPGPVQLAGPQPITPTVSHSLLINTYRTPDTPRDLVGVLKERLPQLLFFYAPWEVDGRVQFALFAGPAYSAVEANELKEPLIEVLERLDPDEWLVRETSYAFFFGEYEDLDGAEARVRELGNMDSPVPAYALTVEYPDGTSGVRVYGGAFTNEFDARPMAEALSESGMEEIPLIERRGRLPE